MDKSIPIWEWIAVSKVFLRKNLQFNHAQIYASLRSIETKL
jgi:hypothetical protein